MSLGQSAYPAHFSDAAYTEAVEDLNRAARLDPTHPFATSHRQVAYELAEGNGAA